MKEIQMLIILFIISQFTICLGLIAGLFLIKSLIEQSRAHTKELRGCIELQFESLRKINKSLERGLVIISDAIDVIGKNINSCTDRAERQITHLFGAHTKELRECIELQFESLRKINKSLERDLVIISDVIGKNIKTYIKKLQELSENF